MKTLKITTDNKLSIVDVDFKGFQIYPAGSRRIFRDCEDKKDVGLLQSSGDYAG